MQDNCRTCAKQILCTERKQNCTEKLTYVQAGILEQPEIIKMCKANIDYGEGESQTAKTMKIISKDVQTILDKAREEFLNDIFRLEQPERRRDVESKRV